MWNEHMPYTKNTNASRHRNVKSRSRTKKLLDLRGNIQAGETCDRIVYLRSLRNQCSAALKLLTEQAEAQFGDATDILTDRHVVHLVEKHMPEVVIAERDVRYFSIKEVKNLDNIFDVISKSLNARNLKVVS